MTQGSGTSFQGSSAGGPGATRVGEDGLPPRVMELCAPLTRAIEDMASRESEHGVLLRDSLDQVHAGVGLVVREHEGMANELLRVYEQFGIVFDVTRRMLMLRDEREVIDLLIARLRTMFPGSRFIAVRETDTAVDARGGADDGRSSGGDAESATARPLDLTGDAADLPEWIRSAVQTVRSTRRVGVANCGKQVGVAADGEVLMDSEALVAPVFAGTGFVCAVVVWRSASSERFQSGDMMLLDSLSTFCGDVIRNFRLVRELQQMSMEMVRSLVSAIDQKDPYTSGHSNRVGYYAKLLGREIGFDAHQLRTLEWSALLHDVGKIGIRDEVLKKPGQLTNDEFQHIKEHPMRGYDVVREMPHMRDALDGVLYHHERFDGSGYPNGLKGEQIPLQARIIQISDVFDALTTTRSYRGAFGWQKALDIIGSEAGTVVDPELAKVFDALMQRLYAQHPEEFGHIGNSQGCPNLEGYYQPEETGVELGSLDPDEIKSAGIS